MQELEDRPNDENGKNNFFTKFLMMFAVFFTTLTIISKYAFNHGLIMKNSMDDLTFAVINSAVLSFMYVIFTFKDKR